MQKYLFSILFVSLLAGASFALPIYDENINPNSAAAAAACDEDSDCRGRKRDFGDGDEDYSSYQEADANEWLWHPSLKGYYTRVKDGPCESGVTVFFERNMYCQGWCIAFDRGLFLNLNLRSSAEAKEKAEELYYTKYCGTNKYKPTCPRGEVPASQLEGRCRR
jgi:hypothetical protein